MTDRDGHDFAATLLSALPAASFVIDGVGTVLFATDNAAAIVGLTAAEITGTSVLAYVDASTAWAYASAVAMATDFPSVTTGPLRVTLIGADGQPKAADLWASNQIDNPEVGGIVCLLTEATTSYGLSEAVAAVAAGEPIHTVAERVTRSLAGHPVVADAAFFVPSGDSFVPFTPSTLPTELIADPEWVRRAMTTGVRVLHPDLELLSRGARRAARAGGYEALWIEPVLTADRPSVGALVLGRRRPGNPTPNQLNVAHQAAAILAVAFKLDALTPTIDQIDRVDHG